MVKKLLASRTFSPMLTCTLRIRLQRRYSRSTKLWARGGRFVQHCQSQANFNRSPLLTQSTHRVVVVTLSLWPIRSLTKFSLLFRRNTRSLKSRNHKLSKTYGYLLTLRSRILLLTLRPKRHSLRILALLALNVSLVTVF